MPARRRCDGATAATRTAANRTAVTGIQEDLPATTLTAADATDSFRASPPDRFVDVGAGGAEVAYHAGSGPTRRAVRARVAGQRCDLPPAAAAPSST
ncbi:MAG: hypothetical protein R2699_19495 [Acidimicrobiales bacterium]